MAAEDAAVSISTRSIRDPAEGVYEYLEERHEEQGFRQGCFLFPVRLSGWILRREGLVTKRFKRRFGVFDAAADELRLYRDDDTSSRTGKLLQRLVLTRVDMTIERDVGDLAATGYERDKEVYKNDSDRITMRRVASGGGVLRQPGDELRFYQSKQEQLRSVSVKASTVWSHCFRHHMKNHKRRKRLMRLAELDTLDRWDLIDEEALFDSDEEEGEAVVEPEFVFSEIRKDPLDGRRERRAPVPRLEFDGEGEIRITKVCDFSSLRGLSCGQVLMLRETTFTDDQVDAGTREKDQIIASANTRDAAATPLAVEMGVVWRPQSSGDMLILSAQSAELVHSSSSIWNDEAMLAHRVDFDSVQRTRLLSSGSFGEVWLAQYRGTQTVAVKCLKQTIERDRDRQRIRDFTREIHILSQLDHHRIVSFVGVAWTKESDVQMLLEFMPYGDLRTYLSYLSSQRQARKSTSAEAGVWNYRQWRVAVDIIEGLVYLHSLNRALVHCDLKSRNLLLDVNVRVKIADFGIARFVTSESEEEPENNHDRGDNVDACRSGLAALSLLENKQLAVRGTGRWIPPELLTGSGELTPAVDVYSFGVVLTEIDTYELPFHNQIVNRDGEEMDENVLLHHVMANGWTPKFSKTCPESVLTIAKRCMAFAPADRPTSLEVAHHLRKAMTEALKPTK